MVPAGCVTPATNEMRTVWVVQLFASDVQLRLVASSRRALHPGWKKPGRRLLSRAAGKLEEDNLFGIRKWNSSCTNAGAKSSQKMDKFEKLKRSCSCGIGEVRPRMTM